MRSKLLYLFSGVLLASVVLVGVGFLRAQAVTPNVPKWEYEWVATHNDNPADALTFVDINGAEGPDYVSGNTFGLFKRLGAEGWEYVDRDGDYYKFKRPLP